MLWNTDIGDTVERDSRWIWDHGPSRASRVFKTPISRSRYYLSYVLPYGQSAADTRTSHQQNVAEGPQHCGMIRNYSQLSRDSPWAYASRTSNTNKTSDFIFYSISPLPPLTEFVTFHHISRVFAGGPISSSRQAVERFKMRWCGLKTRGQDIEKKEEKTIDQLESSRLCMTTMSFQPNGHFNSTSREGSEQQQNSA